MLPAAFDAPLDPATPQALPQEFQEIVHVLCDTYEELDLRIETTLGNAAHDFCAALPEIEGHDEELRQLVRMLINDMHATITSSNGEPVVLRLAFQGEADLTRQLLSSIENHEAIL